MKAVAFERNFGNIQPREDRSIIGQTMQKSMQLLRRYNFSLKISGILFVVFTCIGIIRALQHFYIVDAGETIQFGLWWHVPFNLFLWWSWFFFLPIIYWVNVHCSKSRILGKELLCYVVLPLAVIAIRQLIATLVIRAVLVTYMDFPSVLYQRLFANRWIWLDIVVYFVIVVGVYVVEYQQEEQKSELELTMLKSELTQSQLSALESQLRPHFLFNTLNTISTLILKADSEEARRMLLLLQNLLQTTVYENSQHLIRFDEELQFINQYLEIEKVRFQDKLVVQEDIHQEVLSVVVPRFFLQPIVENAIAHAIAPKTSTGILRISAARDSNWLIVNVEDDGSGLPAFEKRKSSGGVGLKITRERLLRLYHDNQSLMFRTSSLGGLQVSIKIPLMFSPA